MNKPCKTANKTVPPVSAKYWSGRRESNPRMQLGKLDGFECNQELSCKTSLVPVLSDQLVTGRVQNSVWSIQELELLTDLAATIETEDENPNDALPMVRAARARDTEARYALRDRQPHVSRRDFAARLARDEFRGRNAKRCAR